MSSELTKIKAIGVLDFDDYPVARSFSYTPQKQRDHDVDIKIIACGICGADTFAAKGDWMKLYTPLCVGHEIVGKIVAVADSVTKFKPGDRVGVGAQCDCCDSCTRCNEHHENNCRGFKGTFLSVYPETGFGTQGGYASHIRIRDKFVFKIPDALESIHAAPLLCGGVTGFSCLKLAGVKKNTKVGICGIGGIGHMTIQLAKALGAEVTAISRNDTKKELAFRLGADHFISTSKLGEDHSVSTTKENFLNNYFDSLDVIVHTGSSFTENSVSTVLNLLKPNGQLRFINANNFEVCAAQMLMNNYVIGGSACGAPHEIEELLEFAAEHKIKPWVETVDINEENIKTSWERLDKGDVKFRFVLTGYDKFFN